MPPPAALALCLAVASVLSILINLPSATPTRIASALYSTSFWVMGALVVTLTAGLEPKDILDRLASLAAQFGWISGIISIICVVGWYFLGWRFQEISTPVAWAMGSLNEQPFFRDNTILPVLYADHLASGDAPRIVALGPYPTVTATLATYLLPLLLVYRKHHHAGLTWLATAGIVLTLYFTSGRTAVVSAAIVYPMVYLAYRRSLSAWLVVAIPIVFISLPALSALADAVLSTRQSSTTDRTLLYAYQIQQVVEHSPLFGFGVRDRTNDQFLVVGTQSTIFGVLYKEGFIGLLLLVGMLGTATTMWLRALAKIRDPQLRRFVALLGAPILGMNFFVFSEDLDWPQLLCFIYFLAVGAVIAIMRCELLRRKEGGEGR